jgi:Tol biopolymer transport system component/DNA-binding winged helix-turn-helix (wHTH) protein
MQTISEKTTYGYKFDDVEISLADFNVRKAGETRKITPRSFEVLLYLVRNRGRVVEKQELFEQIWRENFVSDNALTRVVREIRQVIGDDAAAPRYIETVPKRGYRFIAEVENLERESNGFERQTDVVRDRGKLSAAPEDDQSAKSPRNSKILYLAPAAAFLLLIVAAGAWLVFRPAASVSDSAATVARTTQLTNWSGLDNFPSISPDGNSVAYSSDRTGSFEIYVRPLAPGAKEIQITSDGRQNFQPAFSPDGRLIAFHSRGRGGIWVVPASGGTAKQLTDFGSHPAFSPDGKQIAFQSGPLTDLGISARTLAPSVLWLVSSDGDGDGGGGGEPRQLTQTGNPAGGHGAPAWSPDGKRIAFSVGDVSSSSVWSIEVASGRTREINTRSGDPVYAPDGKSIYYTSLEGLWQLPISPEDDSPTGAAKLLSDDGPAQIRHLSISADGKKIVHEMLMSASRLLAVDPAAKGALEPAALLQNSAARNTFPFFSPDGGRIAYASLRAGSIGEVWVMNSDGSEAIQVTSGVTFAGWLPDGDRLAFVSGRDGATRLWSISLSGRRETALFTFQSYVEHARFSPDGKKIVFNSRENGTINVWLGDLATGAQKQITFDPELAGFSVWSPDGKWLALQIKRGDNTHVALMPADGSGGGEMIQLTNENGQSWVHSFSPDGDKIAFAGQREGDIWNIYYISRSTREVVKLTDFKKRNTFARYPAWSPRGDKIVFEYTETTGNIWLTQLK